MKIIDTSIVSEELRRGNSMAIVAAKNSSSLNSITMANYTKLPKFRNKKTYDDFEKKIVLSHQALKMHIEKLISKGLKVAGYGAAARGVDTLVIAGINNNHLCAIYDKNTFFHGKNMPVSGISVNSPDQLYLDNPDELIVFNYGYIEEIREYYKNHKVNIVSMLDLMKVNYE